jgi:PhzF family phenazine biosynthesis protein
MDRSFVLVDVFGVGPQRGNPLAVVLDGEGLTTEEMQRFAHWMNLSETTFLLPPSDPGADYRVRIFTPSQELPFAGHPTLGTCHAWLQAGGSPQQPDVIVQQCGAGLVPVRLTSEGLAFAAPPLIRSGPVDDADRARIVAVLGIDDDAIVEAAWVDNGPGWVAVLLADVDQVLALRPGPMDPDMDVGVVALYPSGSAAAIEVRAFFQANGVTVEDPVTGSLNASVAQWLLGTGQAEAPYVASQGTVLGRSGRVHIDRDADGAIWVGGATVACIEGQISI